MLIALVLLQRSFLRQFTLLKNKIFQMPLFLVVQQLLTDHLNSLFRQFDPLKELDTASWHRFQKESQNSRSNPRSWNGHFLLPPFMIVLSALYGIFWLEYEARGEIRLEVLQRSRYIFMHQIMPPPLWDQTRS